MSPNTDIPTPELCDRYADLYTGAITDVMDDQGLYDQTLDPDITPLEPGMSTAGLAFPVVGRPNRNIDGEKNIRRILQMLGAAPEDGVVIYKSNDDRSAHIGELSVTALKEQGCRGAVLDGGVRDTSYILERDFPVFNRYETPADAVYRWEILDWDVSTVVGGVEVQPGDIVVGDLDGVIVVPRVHAESILVDAEDLRESENHVRDAVRNGMAPLEAYDEYGTF